MTVYYFGPHNLFDLSMRKPRYHYCDSVAGKIYHNFKVSDVNMGSTMNTFVNQRDVMLNDRVSVNFNGQGKTRIEELQNIYEYKIVRNEAYYVEGQVTLRTRKPMLNIKSVNLVRNGRKRYWGNDDVILRRYPTDEYAHELTEEKSIIGTWFDVGSGGEANDIADNDIPNPTARLSQLPDIVNIPDDEHFSYKYRKIKDRGNSMYILDISYKIRVRTFAMHYYENFQGTQSGKTARAEYYEADSFHFDVVADSVDTHKNAFRLSVDAVTGEVIDAPSTCKHTYYLRDNPLLTDGAYYLHDDGTKEPLAHKITRDLITRNRNGRLFIKFEIWDTPMFTDENFTTVDPDKKYIDIGDYVRCKDEYGNWYGGKAIEGSGDRTRVFPDKIFRVVRVKFKHKNSMRQICTAIEVTDPVELAEITQ